MGTTVFPKPLDNELDSKAPKASPEFTGSISLGRKANTQIGTGSFAVGDDVTASGSQSFAEGSMTTASGDRSHAEGYYTTAAGFYSHAEGNTSVARGTGSHAGGGHCEAGGQYSFTHGHNVRAYGNATFAYGSWNAQDIPNWEAGTSYAVDDVVVFNNSIYKCTTANSDEEFTISNWTSTNATKTYAEIVGNGTGANALSNARVLDWDGNEHLKGNLYVGANDDGTGGSAVATADALGIQSQERTMLNGQDILDTTLAPGLYYITGAVNAPSSTGAGYLDVSIRKRYGTTIRIVKWRQYNAYPEYINLLPNSSTWSGWRTFETAEGTVVPENTDLDNLTTSGKYHSPNSTRTATLSHIPSEINSGFTMVVKARGSYYDQMIQYKGGVWSRGTDSTGWSDWQRLAMISELADKTRWFFTNTSVSGETKEDAIHALLATIRSSMTSGEMANYAYYDGSVFYAGTIVKVSSKAYRGRMFANDKNSGFYINDNSDNSSATITLFGDTGELPDNTNLNDIKYSCTYILSSSKNYTNAPASYGILEVLVPIANRVVQRLTITNKEYQRYFDGSTWYDWQTVVLHSEYDTMPYTGDADSMPNGIFYCTSDVSNLPTAAAYIVHCMVHATNNTYADQIAYQNQTATNVYIRRRRGSSWTSWIQFVTKDALGDAPVFKTLALANPTTFTISNASRIVVDIVSSTTAYNATLHIYVTNSGGVTCNKVAGDSLSITKSTNSLTISGGTGALYCRIYAGDISIST